MRPALAELRVALEHLPGPESIGSIDAVGIVLLGFDGGPRPVRLAERLRSVSAAPLFAIVSDELSGRSIRALYRAGAAGVFTWPREEPLLARFLAEMLALRFARGRAKRPDIALARTVRTHLKLLPGLAQVPRVEARDGVVTASGSADSLREKYEVERCVSGVPGVRALDLDGLHVLPPPVPDHRIRRAAQRLVQTSPHVDAKT